VAVGKWANTSIFHCAGCMVSFGILSSLLAVLIKDLHSFLQFLEAHAGIVFSDSPQLLPSKSLHSLHAKQVVVLVLL